MSKVLRKECSNLGFDPDELRAKYLAERDKRLRSDGNQQYIIRARLLKPCTADEISVGASLIDWLPTKTGLHVIHHGGAGFGAVSEGESRR